MTSPKALKTPPGELYSTQRPQDTNQAPRIKPRPVKGPYRGSPPGFAHACWLAKGGFDPVS